MTFYSRNNRPKTIASPKCEKIIPTFSLEINKTNGKKELKQNGKTNIYEKIQASKDQTMIYNILDRFKAGDINAINKIEGKYGDFTTAPRTLAEAQQRLIDAENLFKTMPLEIRKEFNHSTSEFLASAANGDLEQRINKHIKKITKTQTQQTEKEQIQQPIQQQVQQNNLQNYNGGQI